MKKCFLPVAVAMALLGTAQPNYASDDQSVPAEQVDAALAAVPPWHGCAVGFSCFWENQGGTGRLWLAPSCGEHHFPFGDWRNNSIGSFWNRGGGTIFFFDSRPPSGSPLDIGFIGEQRNLISTANNRTSSIIINC